MALMVMLQALVPTLLQGSYNTAVYNGNTGFLIGTLPNPGLRWEKQKQLKLVWI